MSEKLGLVGRKIGMTRIFTDDGVSVPVTVLDVSNNRVTMVKTQDTDGYTAVQVAFGTKKPSRVSKPLAGQFAKAGVEAACTLKEFRIDAEKAAEFKPGQTISVEIFTEGQKVDVTGTTIGKGFAGAIKRHHFSSNRASHGNSVTTRAPGSIGNRQDPGRVFPASAWPAIWVTCSARPRIWSLPALTRNVSFCWFAVPFRAPRAVK